MIKQQYSLHEIGKENRQNEPVYFRLQRQFSPGYAQASSVDTGSSQQRDQLYSLDENAEENDDNSVADII